MSDVRRLEPPVVVPEQRDIYSHERASLREHMEILNGRSTWREPSTPGTKTDKVPYEHTLSAALSYARSRVDGSDVGPDILESLIYRRLVHEDEIVTQLVRALADMSKRLAFVDRRVLRRAAYVVLVECVRGVEARRPHGMGNRDWVAASALAIRLIWASAGTTIQRAAEKLR